MLEFINNCKYSKMKNIITKITWVVALFSLYACDMSSDDSMPIKETTAQYTFVREGLPGRITFLNTSENANSFQWNFGDNTTSTVKNPVKIFQQTGDYVVTLTATNTKTGVSKTFSSTVSVFIFQGGLVANGDFESGTAPWSLGVGNPLPAGLLTTSNGNTYASFNVAAAGNPFDVNLSQTGINITQGTTYRLTFDAWSNVNRTMVVGIGLSGAPFTNQSVTRNLTPQVQSFSIDLVANFTSTNSRVLFDLGAAVGVVNIDNVTLTQL